MPTYRVPVMATDYVEVEADSEWEAREQSVSVATSRSNQSPDWLHDRSTEVERVPADAEESNE